MTTRASVTSTEHYRTTIVPSPDEDPTSFPVRFSFPVEGQPPSVWVNGSWESGGPPWIASTDIGPTTDSELDEGSYDVYVEIDDGDETPRFQVDRLVIFSTSYPLLATVSDLADQTGTDINPEDAAAFAALQYASDYVRQMTGQYISYVQDDEVELTGTWAKELKLPQKPVIDVTAVGIRYGWDDQFTTVTPTDPITRRGLLLNGGGWGGPTASVRVTYSHGYEVIPPAIVGLVCGIASRRRTTASALQSEQIGEYRYEVASGTDGTPVDLTSMEQKLIARIRKAAAA